MRKILATIFVSLSPGIASAGLIECTWNDWSGGSTEQVVSWLGEKVRLDTTKNTIRIGLSNGWYAPFAIERIMKNSNFTAYVGYSIVKSATNDTYRSRVSLRVYKTGRGEILNTEEGFLPLSARGQCREVR